MGPGAAGVDPSATLHRVPATSRRLGDRLFVSPVGWSSGAFELAGAAVIVWTALELPAAPNELATRCGVEPDDEFLRLAVATLVDMELVGGRDDR